MISLSSSVLSEGKDKKNSLVVQQKTLPQLSVQLWSVRDLLEKSFSKTIRKLAELGFQGVEFAGNYGPYGENPQELKQFLDSLGLQVSGVHVSFDELKPAVIDKHLNFFKTLNVKYVIVPWDERAWQEQGVKSLVDDLNQLVAKLAKFGMKIGFHNHDEEFNSFKGATFWDYIAQNTSNEVVLQLDVGWVHYAGKQAIDYVKKYTNRTLTTHYKIRAHKGQNLSPIIGDNQIQWKQLILANIESGGTRWIVLEQEEYPDGMSSIEAVARSKKGLDRILADVAIDKSINGK